VSTCRTVPYCKCTSCLFRIANIAWSCVAQSRRILSPGCTLFEEEGEPHASKHWICPGPRADLTSLLAEAVPASVVATRSMSPACLDQHVWHQHVWAERAWANVLGPTWRTSLHSLDSVRSHPRPGIRQFRGQFFKGGQFIGFSQCGNCCD
jgi:hypothetical protein